MSAHNGPVSSNKKNASVQHSPPGEGRQAGGDKTSRATHKAKKVIAELDSYPHNIHPALVPGVSIEDQKVRYGVDKTIVIPVGVAVIAFILWGINSPETVTSVSTNALNWVMENLGWVFNSLAVFFFVFLIALAVSRYGKIPLGLDGEPQEYSTASWVAMLFAAGIGIGIIFFGPLEPLTHYLTPRPGAYDPASQEAVKGAMAQAAVHWGFSAWATYAVVGLGVGYVSFRKGRVPLMSSVLQPLFGGHSKSVGARLVDGFAIIATLFGTAASLGLGALQIGRGLQILTGWDATRNTLAIIIITVLTVATVISAVSGVARGIRRLSNINMVLSVVLAFFFFIAGPTVFLMNIIPGVIVEYTQALHETFALTMSDGPEVEALLKGWTTFFWAWWVSWAPFVGVFTAKISRGRTIRQFVMGVLFIPSTIIILAFTILGGTTIWLQRQNGSIVPGNDPEMMPAQEDIFFMVLDQLPGQQLVAPLVVVMLGVFFITSADSASLVNSQLSQGGNPNPKRGVTVLWALLMAGIAAVMLLMGGPNTLSGLQNLVTVTALPFAIVLVLMCVGIYKELRNDPMMIREYYERTAVQRAVRHGISHHGDNFELAIEPVDEESDRGVGNDFDSTSSEYTEWYLRTDEDGNPVEYDYDAGAYLDPETGQPMLEEIDPDAAASDSSLASGDVELDDKLVNEDEIDLDPEQGLNR